MSRLNYRKAGFPAQLAIRVQPTNLYTGLAACVGRRRKEALSRDKVEAAIGSSTVSCGHKTAWTAGLSLDLD